MAETNEELRDEIRGLLDVPAYAAGNTQLRSVTLERALEALGGQPWGGGPSLRGQIRDELGHGDGSDSSGFRKEDLVELRDALQEAVDD